MSTTVQERISHLQHHGDGNKAASKAIRTSVQANPAHRRGAAGEHCALCHRLRVVGSVHGDLPAKIKAATIPLRFCTHEKPAREVQKDRSTRKDRRKSLLKDERTILAQ